MRCYKWFNRWDYQEEKRMEEKPRVHMDFGVILLIIVIIIVVIIIIEEKKGKPSSSRLEKMPSPTRT